MINLVRATYEAPRFRTKIPISDEFNQATSIRQGRPLSSDLYVVVASCLMTILLKDCLADVPEL